MRTQTEGDQIVVFPVGRINNDNAREFEEETRKILSGNPGKQLVIDADELDYISSAGLRVLLKLTTETGSPVSVRNVGAELYEIFDMTGFTQLLSVTKKMKEINVDGCEIIGRGAYGTVYKIDADTIVKVYDSAETLPLIETERKKAKKAFIKGIPTAISYDIVRVGDSYGSVFELLHADNLNDVIREEPERADELMAKYVNMIKSVHKVEAESSEFPRAGKNFIKCLDELGDVIPQDVSEGIRKLLNEMPEDNHIIHGDLQMKNVMFADEEPMLIDMESLSTGDPVFDLQSLFLCYCAYNEDEPDNTESFLGITRETAESIWKQILKLYFEGFSEEQIRKEEDRIRLLGYVGFLISVVLNGFTKPELREIRIAHAVEHMRELLPKVNTFVITKP